MLRWLGFTQRHHHHHHHRREPVQPDPTRRRRWPCVATPRPLVFVVSLAFFLSHFFSSLSRFWLPTPTNPGASVSMDFIRGVVVSLFGFLWFARIWFDRLLIVWSSFFCVAKTIHFSYFFSTESALVSSIVAEFQGHLRGFLPSFFFTEFFFRIASLGRRRNRENGDRQSRLDFRDSLRHKGKPKEEKQTTNEESRPNAVRLGLPSFARHGLSKRLWKKLISRRAATPMEMETPLIRRPRQDLAAS